MRDKVNALIEDIQRNPYRGLGKPERLKRNLAGWWSRRITREHRLVYRVRGGELQIAQCRYHY
jgi:toxin YoeB